MVTRNFYLHVMNGAPAQFQPSTKTIVFAGKHCSRLATSLKQIRREQAIDRATVAGTNMANTYDLSYVRIPVAAVLK
jgi:hypothetical protein